VFESLEAENIDSVVLAYASTSGNTSRRLSEIQHLWQVLETNVQSGRISRIGLSDVDTDLFITLYNSAKVTLEASNSLTNYFGLVKLKFLFQAKSKDENKNM
jgi:diketogulonate reductase-like aldo/keto reductase